MDPKETIKKNIKRRSEFVDVVELHNDIPKPTWVELSLIDVCNRKCVFCPKSNENIAPDTFQKMNSQSMCGRSTDTSKGSPYSSPNAMLTRVVAELYRLATF